MAEKRGVLALVDDPEVAACSDSDGDANSFTLKRHCVRTAKFVDECQRWTLTTSQGQQYWVGSVVGEGTFSLVREGKDAKTGRAVALKFFRCNGAYSCCKELRALRLLSRHPNIIGHVDFIEHGKLAEDSNAVTSVIVQDFAARGDMFSYVECGGGLPEEASKHVAKALIRALSHVHQLRIAHRDVKLEQVLLTSKFDIKLSDFGLALMYALDEQKESLSICGTRMYMAPELLNRRQTKDQKPSSWNNLAAVDVWAFGVLLYILVCGFPPWTEASSDRSPQYRLWVSSRVGDCQLFWRATERRLGRGLSTQFKCLIHRLLMPVPLERASMQTLMADPWVHGATADAEHIFLAEMGKRWTIISKLAKSSK